MANRSDFLVRIRPWEDLMCVSQGRTVLATDRDGFFDGGPNRGLFVHQTRLVSRYRYLIDGRPPRIVAGSNVAQHGSWHLRQASEGRPRQLPAGSVAEFSAYRARRLHNL
jgi:hypothetical protein